MPWFSHEGLFLIMTLDFCSCISLIIIISNLHCGVSNDIVFFVATYCMACTSK